MSLLRKEMEKYRDVDEDELLKKLSEDELLRLEDELQELDPDNALLPAGLRQKDQTKKAPTGSFQRDNLLAHLEKQAKEHPDREDLVPFTGEKRGLKPIGSSPGRCPPMLLLIRLKKPPASRLSSPWFKPRPCRRTPSRKFLLKITPANHSSLPREKPVKTWF